MAETTDRGFGKHLAVPLRELAAEHYDDARGRRAVYIGIDPGVSGGLAAVDQDGAFVESSKMPLTQRDMLDVMGVIGLGAGGSHNRFAVLERVGASPQMGVVSAFTFGRSYERVLMALTAACIPFDEVTPRTWQGALGCLSGGDKNITKRRAQQLFPKISVTHAIADALLLAEYSRRLRRGLFVPSARRQRNGKGKAQEVGR